MAAVGMKCFHGLKTEGIPEKGCRKKTSLSGHPDREEGNGVYKNREISTGSSLHEFCVRFCKKEHTCGFRNYGLFFLNVSTCAFAARARVLVSDMK